MTREEARGWVRERIWRLAPNSFGRYYGDDPCVYCGGIAGSEDHVVPRSAGGPDTLYNRAPACPSCNNQKRSAPLLVFLAFGGVGAKEWTRRWVPTGETIFRRQRPKYCNIHGVKIRRYRSRHPICPWCRKEKERKRVRP